jgi:regulatory protein
MIELAGEAWAEIDAEVVVRLGLKRGFALTQADRERILHADQVLRARRWAAARSAARPRSRRSLEQDLCARKFSATVIHEALDTLEASGTINDSEVAARHLRKRGREGGYGPERLRSELLGLGLSPEAAATALAANHRADPLEACLELAGKRAARYMPLHDVKNRTRLMQFLQRRGFEAETVRRAMDRILSRDA